MKKEKTNTWGGARKGAGRPKNDSRRYGFKVGGEVADLIDAQENKSEFIKDCIERGIKSLSMGLTEQATTVGLSLMVENEGEEMPMIGIYDTEMPVACGIPLGVGDVDYIELSDLGEKLSPHGRPSMACRVQGESMIGAHMFPGDIVICDVSPRVPSGDEVSLCELNGEFTFKYVRRHDGRVWLVPDNPEFEEREVMRTDEFHVRGIVTSVVHIM